jgi:hypothetical protein
MKKKTIFIVALFFLFCLPYQVVAQPKVLVENPVFTFETVPEGVHVLHEFIIKNSGDTVLNILNVLPP